MTQSHEYREQGLELGEVREALQAHDFPTSAASIVDDHGDCEVGMPGATRTLREVLPEPPDQSYASPAEARRAIIGLVGGAAVGRRNYSDRDPPTPSEAPAVPRSF